MQMFNCDNCLCLASLETRETIMSIYADDFYKMDYFFQSHIRCLQRNQSNWSITVRLILRERKKKMLVRVGFVCFSPRLQGWGLFFCVFICLWAVTFSSPILNSNISPFPPAISWLRRMHIYEAHFHALFFVFFFFWLLLQRRQAATRSNIWLRPFNLILNSCPSSSPPPIKPYKSNRTAHSVASRGSQWFILMDESELLERRLLSTEIDSSVCVCSCLIRSTPVKNDGLLIWRRPGRDVPRVRRQGFRISLRTSDLWELQG